MTLVLWQVDPKQLSLHPQIAPLRVGICVATLPWQIVSWTSKSTIFYSIIYGVLHSKQQAVCLIYCCVLIYWYCIFFPTYWPAFSVSVMRKLTCKLYHQPRPTNTRLQLSQKSKDQRHQWLLSCLAVYRTTWGQWHRVQTSPSWQIWSMEASPLRVESAWKKKEIHRSDLIYIISMSKFSVSKRCS